MHRLLALLALLAVATVVAAACSPETDRGEAAIPTAATTPATTTTGPPTVAALTPLEVVLVTPGTAPRQVLRHTFAVGSSSTGELQFALDVEGIAAVEVVGPNTITIQSVVDDVANADYTLGGLDVTESTLGAPVVDALTLSGQITVQSDRTATAATIQTSSNGVIPGLDAVAGSLDPRLASLLFPFPDEPIGPGAEWEIRGPLPFIGGSVDLVAAARLVARDGDQFEVAVAITMTSPDGESNRIEAGGFGELVGRVDRLVPVAGSIVAEGTIILDDRGPTPFPLALDLRIAGR